MDFVVDGYARFIHNGNEGTGIEFTNSGSNIIMKFLSIETTFNDINTPAIHTSNRIEGNAGSTSGNSGTLNFDGGNNIYIYADRITALANDYIVLYTLTQNG